MKKLILLFTIVCAGSLYGMKPEHKMGDFGELPGDVHNEIIKKALASSDTVEEAIRAIKVANVLRGARYDNLENFTKIVHLLADKFGMSTHEVADKFGTSTAEKYDELGDNLMISVMFPSVREIPLIIKEGADVNYSTGRYSNDGQKETPLSRVKDYMYTYTFGDFSYKKIEQILINAGAK